ncbi:MAG: DinB family protein [Actinomycetota bacterium]|nr:DinB family protein [Actinomycetota bacterium]
MPPASSPPPEENYARRWPDDPRPPLPQAGDELTMLTAYLDWHRQTFALKCAGLTPEQLSSRSMPPSTMSLHGLLRHLSGVERWWFQINFAAEQVLMLYYSDDDPDQDFDDLGGDVEEAFAVWRAECERSRQIVSSCASLEVAGTRVRDGEPISLRGVLVKMIAEYAQHNGHADLLREGVDGRTGQ